MKICVINTGGTISCVGAPLAPMPAEQFAAASERLLNPILAQAFPGDEIVYDTALRFPESRTGTLDSTNLQPSDWALMARSVLDAYSAHDGFVILHGTDSMDFTGAALPLLLNVFDAQGNGRALLSKPVILTGSQLPMFHQGADGALSLNCDTDAFRNLCGAVACARTGLPEVGLYFDGKLMRANRSLKVDANRFAAFDSPNCLPLAEVGIALTRGPAQWLPAPEPGLSLDGAAPRALAMQQLDQVARRIDDFPAMTFNAFPAPYHQQKGEAVIARLVDAAVAAGIRGIVLESYGEGNFPSGDPDRPGEGAICTALTRANAAGVIIVNATQVLRGRVDDSAYAAGAWLPKAGALPGADMTPMAALAKLTILSAAAGLHGWSAADVKRLVAKDLAGELTEAGAI